MKFQTATAILALVLLVGTAAAVTGLSIYGDSAQNQAPWTPWSVVTFGMFGIQSTAGPTVTLELLYSSSPAVSNLTASLVVQVLSVQVPREVLFPNVTNQNPLNSGNTTTGSATFFGGAVSCDGSYNVTLSGSYVTGAPFTYVLVHPLECLE